MLFSVVLKKISFNVFKALLNFSAGNFVLVMQLRQDRLRDDQVLHGCDYVLVLVHVYIHAGLLLQLVREFTSKFVASYGA